MKVTEVERNAHEDISGKGKLSILWKFVSGDPIADAFAVVARKNNAVLLIADGVNWGEKSKLAARCALYGCMTHIQTQLFVENNQPMSTQVGQ